MNARPPEDGRGPQDSGFEQERHGMHRRILTSVAHDLKTPLACIIGSLQTYRRSDAKLSAASKSMLIESALQEAYRLDDFVTNLLEMAQLESGAVRLKAELCSIETLLKDCVATLGRRLTDCRVDVNAKSPAFSVQVDPLLLTRALGTVLDNAAKYGGPQPKIGIEYEKIGGALTIRICDNGPGIPEDQRERIFMKYTRLAVTGNGPSGAGLGLAICREIMRLLGGTVDARNAAEGTGAVFTFSLAA